MLRACCDGVCFPRYDRKGKSASRKWLIAYKSSNSVSRAINGNLNRTFHPSSISITTRNQNRCDAAVCWREWESRNALHSRECRGFMNRSCHGAFTPQSISLEGITSPSRHPPFGRVREYPPPCNHFVTHWQLPLLAVRERGCRTLETLRRCRPRGQSERVHTRW